MVDDTQHLHAPAAASELLLARVRPLRTEDVPVSVALAGRVPAEALVAQVDLPPFANSAMDGYALRAAESGGPLPVRGRVAAGDDPPPLPPGSAMGIATGAAMPEGADAVVPIELADETDGVVRAHAPADVGRNVRLPGEDVRAGDELAPAGVRLTSLAASAAAAAGLAAVPCYRRPRVVVLVTGDELAAPGASLRHGQIHESNSVLAAARCAELGAEVVAVERVPDDGDATRAAFARAVEIADLVLSSGGVSVGPHDHVKAALAELDAEELFWRVAIQPGKPLWAGLVGDVVVLGLPGNPLSVVAGLELFARPVLAALEGVAEPAVERRRVRLARALQRNPLRTRVLPVRVEDGQAVPLGADRSHQLVRSAAANALALVDPGRGEQPAGSDVDVVLF